MAACRVLISQIVPYYKALGIYTSSLSELATDCPSRACGMVFYWYYQRRAQLCRPPSGEDGGSEAFRCHAFSLGQNNRLCPPIFLRRSISSWRSVCGI